MNSNDPRQTITRTLVPDGDSARSNCIAQHFGRHCIAVESFVYHFARRLVPEYSGGYWHFYELSNGGFYMAPTLEQARVEVHGNGYEGSMSGDAIGITLCLFAFSHGSFAFPLESCYATHYHLLRDFSCLHAELSEINQAID